MVRPTRGRSRALAAVATVVATFSALVAAGGSVGATSPLPIMPLGDSITDGFNIPGGYRIDLEDDLIAAGLPPDFRGTLQNGPAALADRDHEGHSGWRIDELQGSIDGWLTTYQPEVVLLMIGTNDITQDYQVSTAPSRLAALLDRIHVVRPTTKLLLSTIPPLADAADNAQAVTFNDAIPGLVQARASQGRPISFVDAGRRLTLSQLADGVHPNASGYSSLSDSWRDAIVAAVGANAPPTVALTAPADGASYPAGATVELAASASDNDGQVSKVEFYAGQTKLGEDPTAPYTHSWTNPPSGNHQLTARATDNQNATTTSPSRSITIAGPNSPPQATAKSVTTTAGTGVDVVLEGADTESCELTFEVTVSPTHGALGPIAALGCTPGAPNRDTARVTYAPAAAYLGQDTFSYRVSDGSAWSAVVAVSIRIDPAQSGGVLSVGDLDGQVRPTGKNWTASVTVAVVDGGAAAVAGVSVSGSWSPGGAGSCTTDTTGRCTITRSGIQKNTSSVRFAVSQLTKASFTYDPTRNSDPDGDSNGTAITVLRP